MHNNHGFTLLELTMAVAILSVVSMMSLMAIMSTTESTQLTATMSSCHSEARAVLSALSRELELSATSSDEDLSPALQAITLAEEPPEGAQWELTFQVPVDPVAGLWSEPITYRYMNEDLNGNALLDAGEDTDEDGRLSRHLLRMQTVDGVPQITLLAAARNISRLDLVPLIDEEGVPQRLSVLVACSTNPSGEAEGSLISTRLSGNIYLSN